MRILLLIEAEYQSHLILISVKCQMLSSYRSSDQQEPSVRHKLTANIKPIGPISHLVQYLP